MGPTIRKETLFDGLNVDEQRRLYFLLLGIDQLEPREALALAERIDAFITAKSRSTHDAAEVAVGAGTPSSADAAALERPTQDATVSGSAQRLPDKASPVPQRGKLNKPTQIEFFKAVARGATNAELAERFGLTKRQAQAFRIGMARRSRSAKPSSGAEDQGVGGSPACPAEPSASDAEVVRFLRQVGDVVVKDGDVFVVNSILRLSFQELVLRANTKRLQRGKATFDIPSHDAPRVALTANGNGIGTRG